MNSYFGTGRLKPLASTAQGVVVGKHDGSRATLYVGSLDDPVVFYHEAAHEALFTTTIDGSILAVLWHAIDRLGITDARLLKDVSATARALMVSSRFAHEVVATYYGIKMVDDKPGALALAKLPRSYRTYFKTASEVIDPWFKSSFLQVRVILALGNFTFRSPFARRFFQDHSSRSPD